MAKNNARSKAEKPVLVEITRHIGYPAPIRRAPGQRVLLTPTQIREQKLGKGDFRIIRPDKDREIKGPDKSR